MAKNVFREEFDGEYGQLGGGQKGNVPLTITTYARRRGVGIQITIGVAYVTMTLKKFEKFLEEARKAVK